jgi:hypothetical protein
MLRKYLEEPRTIKAVTDFRLIKQFITNARKINALTTLSKRLNDFYSRHDTPLSHLDIQSATIHAQARMLVKKVGALEQSIASIAPEDFYGEEELWNAITHLIAVLEEKLRKADKRR